MKIARILLIVVVLIGCALACSTPRPVLTNTKEIRTVKSGSPIVVRERDTVWFEKPRPNMGSNMFRTKQYFDSVLNAYKAENAFLYKGMNRFSFFVDSLSKANYNMKLQNQNLYESKLEAEQKEWRTNNALLLERLKNFKLSTTVIVQDSYTSILLLSGLGINLIAMFLLHLYRIRVTRKLTSINA